MTSAFVCYSHKDKQAARFLANELRKRRVDVFIDYQGIGAGELEEQLGRQIMANEYFIPVISPRSVESKWVRAEIALAREEKDRSKIIPVLLEKTTWFKVFSLITLTRIDFTEWRPETPMSEAIDELARLMGLPVKELEAEPVSPTELAVSRERAHLTLYRTGEKAPHSGRYIWVRYIDGSYLPRPTSEETLIQLQRGQVFPPVRSASKGNFWRPA